LDRRIITYTLHIMIEIFAKLDRDGDSAQEDHIFTGRKQDLTNISKWASKAYQLNKRKKAILKIAKLFSDAALLEPTFLRLSKKECRVLVDSMFDLKSSTKSKPLNIFCEMIGTSLCVY